MGMTEVVKKKKKKNDREHNATPHMLNQAIQHKFRGKGGNNANPSSNLGLFQRGRKAVPTATQFGSSSVWEMNFTPMSRSAHSNAKKTESNREKGKKAKYKSGHVRRETRLKQAFEKMASLDNLEPESDSSSQRLSANTNNKSKGKEMYSKYGRKSNNKKPRASNNVVEF